MNYYSYPKIVPVQIFIAGKKVIFNVECVADMRKEDVGSGWSECHGRPVRESILIWEIDNIHIKSIEFFTGGRGAESNRYEMTEKQFRDWSPMTFHRIEKALEKKHEKYAIEFEAMDEW